MFDKKNEKGNTRTQFADRIDRRGTEGWWSGAGGLSQHNIIWSDNRADNARCGLSFENGSVFANGDRSEYAFCCSGYNQTYTVQSFITNRRSFIKSAACFINHASKSNEIRVYQYFTQIRKILS